MKTKKLTPLTIAPVKRENVATVSQNGNAIAVSWIVTAPVPGAPPFAGDDAE